jgi:heptosyltransferase III
VSRRCLVVHSGALGDVLLAGPALAHLRALGFRSTLAVAPRLVSLFSGSRLADEARDLESLALHRLFVDPPDPGALDTLATFDALVSWLGAGDPAFRANVARLGRPAVVARAVPALAARCHASRHLVETLGPLGPLPAALPSARVRVAERDRAVARAWLAARDLEPAEAVVLQPGAGSVTKIWPGFAALARHLRDAGLPVLALAGPADGMVMEALLAADALDERELVRDWPLGEIAGLLSLARGVVGNDSGPTHLAAAVGCPTVALFGPTDPAVWAPLGAHVVVLSGESGDAPWPDVDRVVAALRPMLAGSGAWMPAELPRAEAGVAWL